MSGMTSGAGGHVGTLAGDAAGERARIETDGDVGPEAIADHEALCDGEAVWRRFCDEHVTTAFSNGCTFFV